MMQEEYKQIGKLKLITNPKSLTLKIESSPIEEFNNALKTFVNDLAEVMIKADGSGISAIQVGVPIRLFLMDETETHNVIPIINPEILEKEKIVKSYAEGCLSFPEKRLDIKRYKRIKVRYQDLDGKVHERKLANRESFIFQHELDHLNGKLFTDK
jgi:peptide deformylase